MTNRERGTTVNGGQFPSHIIEKVWEKAHIVDEYDPDYVRVDRSGRYIEYDHYGNTGSQYGWEIDHITPVNLNGSDHINNLQPLQWFVNRHNGKRTRYNYNSTDKTRGHFY